MFTLPSPCPSTLQIFFIKRLFHVYYIHVQRISNGIPWFLFYWSQNKIWSDDIWYLQGVNTFNIQYNIIFPFASTSIECQTTVPATIDPINANQCSNFQTFQVQIADFFKMMLCLAVTLYFHPHAGHLFTPLCRPIWDIFDFYPFM